jgi:hypothetical protein
MSSSHQLQHLRRIGARTAATSALAVSARCGVANHSPPSTRGGECVRSSTVGCTETAGVVVAAAVTAAAVAVVAAAAAAVTPTTTRGAVVAVDVVVAVARDVRCRGGATAKGCSHSARTRAAASLGATAPPSSPPSSPSCLSSSSSPPLPLPESNRSAIAQR